MTSQIVKFMYVEDMIDNKTTDLYFEDPSLDQILDAISRMGGTRRTYVSLHASDEVLLVIGGGEAGKFIVDHWDGDLGEEHHLIDPSVTSDAPVEIVMVHARVRPAFEIVDLATVRTAATTYATTGKLAEELQWKKA